MAPREYPNFDSSMIKTTGSSSTDGSRRIAIETNSFDMKTVSNTVLHKPHGYHDGSNRLSNGNPAPLMARDEPNALVTQGDKKMFLKRRTSDGFMSSGSGSGSSPAKDSSGYGSPLRNMLRVNNGRSSGDRIEPSKHFFTNPAQNQNMGSPLLRPTPSQVSESYNGGYQSFFMKRIHSIDSNVSSESELPHGHTSFTRQPISRISPDLARAMTAVVVNSNVGPRPAINNTLTNTLGRYQPVSGGSTVKTDYTNPIVMADQQKPIYNIYNGTPASTTFHNGSPASTTYQDSRPRAVTDVQQPMLRVSTHLHYPSQSTTISSRGSYSHIPPKAGGGLVIPPTSYHISANTYIHHK